MLTLNDSAKLSRAEYAVNTLVNAANQVSAFGPGNVVYVNIDVPADAAAASASGYEVKYSITMMGSQTEVWRRTKSPISPVTLPTSPGLYVIKVEMTDENVVITQI